MNLQPENPSRIRVLIVSLLGPVSLARIMFILMATYLGYQVRPHPLNQTFLSSDNMLYAGGALALSVVVVIFEYATNIISSKNLLLAACGLLFGLVLAFFFYPVIPEQLASHTLSHAVTGLIFGYFGIVLAIKHADRFRLSNLKFILSNTSGSPYILDSSAIIDGRISDLLSLNLLRGPSIVPQFVLTEIQSIADSADPQRRARGRRGLEILERIRKKCPDLRIWAHDYLETPEVDQKLIQMAKEIQGCLVTNDYNLEKVASLQRIEVININEVASVLRPAVFVGHTFRVDIMREGKESHQGVGYLDDGTMVVVDEGRPYLGQEIEVTVSSILQTGAGRMVFAKPRPGTAKVVRAASEEQA